MATASLNVFLQRLARGMAAAAMGEQSDRQLVAEFLARREPAVFEAIVRRHGTMVYRVCWRVLQQEQDAEDAFQATFLVLGQKLSGLRRHASLASWLHGVAHRLALKARAQALARRRREQAAPRRPPGPPDDVTWGELRCILDGELANLPEKWRLPLILCCLEGRTQDETAAQLGWSKNTVRRRLDEARADLRRRLDRRGLVLPAALSAVLLSECVAGAAPPAPLIAATVEAATALAAGQTLIAAGVSAKVAGLTQGMMQALLLGRIKAAGLLLGMACLLGSSALGGAGRGADPARADAPAVVLAVQVPPPADEQDQPQPGKEPPSPPDAPAKRDAAAPPPRLDHDVHLPLKGDQTQAPGLTLLGPDAEKCVHFGPDGIRIVLPLDYPGERPFTGFRVPVAASGDFEVTVSFEILKEPTSTDAGPRGTKLTVGVFLDAPQENLARLARRVGSKGVSQFSTWTIKEAAPGAKPQTSYKAFPTTTKAGRLRVVRLGENVSYYVARDSDADFVLLESRPLGRNDLEEVQIGASTGGPLAELEARISDLHIRSGALPPVPTAAPDAPRGSGRLALLLVLLAVAGGMALAVGMYVRRRQAQVPGQPVSGPAPATVVVRCAGCGKSFKVRGELAGKSVKCPQCGTAIPVP
jgi:RNA polymerase sigma factor (sigma-70 family)